MFYQNDKEQFNEYTSKSEFPQQNQYQIQSYQYNSQQSMDEDDSIDVMEFLEKHEKEQSQNLNNIQNQGQNLQSSNTINSFQQKQYENNQFKNENFDQSTEFHQGQQQNSISLNFNQKNTGDTINQLKQQPFLQQQTKKLPIESDSDSESSNFDIDKIIEESQKQQQQKQDLNYNNNRAEDKNDSSSKNIIQNIISKYSSTNQQSQQSPRSEEELHRQILKENCKKPKIQDKKNEIKKKKKLKIFYDQSSSEEEYSQNKNEYEQEEGDFDSQIVQDEQNYFSQNESSFKKTGEQQETQLQIDNDYEQKQQKEKQEKPVKIRIFDSDFDSVDSQDQEQEEEEKIDRSHLNMKQKKRRLVIDDEEEEDDDDNLFQPQRRIKQSVGKLSAISSILSQQEEIQKNEHLNELDNENIQNMKFKRLKKKIIKDKEARQGKKSNISKTSGEKNKKKQVHLDLKQDANCCICIDTPEDNIYGVLKCKHQYCIQCILDWANQTNLCPMCRQEFREIIKKNMIDESEVRIPVKAKKQRIHQDDQDEQFDYHDSELENLEDECYVCRSREYPENMLICDNCNVKVCHAMCDEENEDGTIPAGDWYCHECREEDRNFIEESDYDSDS